MSRLAGWIATLGPVGYWPLGPGTLASAIVAAGWWAWRPSALPWWAFVVAVSALGIATAGSAERRLGRVDDGRIVIDEVAGMGLALVAAPAGSAGAIVAFVLFRLFDIAKPPPIGRLQDLHGAAGVVLDDLAAGALAGFATWAGFRLLGGGA